MRFLLATVGTRGDILPFVYLALRLAEAGHFAAVATDPMHEPLIRKLGVRWEKLGSFEPAEFQAAMFRVMRHPTIHERTMAAAEELLLSRQDVLASDLESIQSGFRFDHLICSEPVLFLSPEILARTPVTLLSHTSINPQQVSIYRQTVPALSRVWAVDPELMTLPPGVGGEWHQIGHIGNPQAAGELPAYLTDFLSRGEPPVFVTLGSMAGLDATALSQGILAALRRSGVRAVVQKGSAGLSGAADDALIFVDEIPYAALLPQVSAVVLHGGVGTFADAVRASRPVIFLPQVSDQEVWAARAVALGVSPGYLAPQGFDASALADLLDAAVGEPIYASAARRLGDELGRAGDGGLAFTRLLSEDRLGVT